MSNLALNITLTLSFFLICVAWIWIYLRSYKRKTFRRGDIFFSDCSMIMRETVYWEEEKIYEAVEAVRIFSDTIVSIGYDDSINLHVNNTKKLKNTVWDSPIFKFGVKIEVFIHNEKIGEKLKEKIEKEMEMRSIMES